MKAIPIIILFLFSTLHFSCDTKDDIIDIDPSIVELTFNLENDQDQMGTLFYNAITIYDRKVWSVGMTNSYTNRMAYTTRVNNTRGKPTMHLSEF